MPTTLSKPAKADSDISDDFEHYLRSRESFTYLADLYHDFRSAPASQFSSSLRYLCFNPKDYQSEDLDASTNGESSQQAQGNGQQDEELDRAEQESAATSSDPATVSDMVQQMSVAFDQPKRGCHELWSVAWSSIDGED